MGYDRKFQNMPIQTRNNDFSLNLSLNSIWFPFFSGAPVIAERET